MVKGINQHGVELLLDALHLQSQPGGEDQLIHGVLQGGGGGGPGVCRGRPAAGLQTLALQLGH